MKMFRFIMVSILVSLGGFLLSQPSQAAGVDNGGFMSLWNTYSRCQASSDLAQLRENALALTNAANHSHPDEGFVLPLPSKLEQFVSTPTARFAVDVKAMAASCTLRAGFAAVEAGELEVAKDLLRTILTYQPQSEYSYYSLQAKSLLSELETSVVEVTLNLP
jgi:hypothetical protein